MSEPNGKGWKAALLATGRPLEKSVAECVFGLSGARPRGNYAFSRISVEGSPVSHSVDLLAEWNDPGKDIAIDFLIEAKYRSRPKTWVYRKSEPGLPGGVSSAMLFQSTDDLDAGRHFNRKQFREVSDYSFPLGRDPFELLNPAKSPKPAQCDDGGRQLAYGTASRIAEAALDTLNDGQLRFVIPIAVTTARLCILKSDPTMEQVVGANSLDEIVEDANLIVSRFSAGDLEGHVLLRLRELAKQRGRERVETALSRQGVPSLDALAKSIMSTMDGTYLVVKYQRLLQALQKSSSFCVSHTMDHFSIKHLNAAKAAVAAVAPAVKAGNG